MPTRLRHIVLAAASIPDKAGMYRGVRRWLDRDQSLRVRVFTPRSLEQARSLQCDGLICEPTDLTAEIARDARFPIVLLVDVPDAQDGYVVAFDDHAAGRLAAEHFLDQGYWQFLYVGYSPLPGWGTQRAQGFSERLGEDGRTHASLYVNELPFDPLLPHVMVQHHAVRLEAIAGFLKAQPKPLAVFAGDDTLAMMVVDACELAQLSIPSDVALLGVNNDPVCELVNPPLSSIALPSERVGFEAMATMSALLKGDRKVPRRTFLLPTGVMVRRSSDALQVRDAAVATALRYIRDHPNDALGVKEIAAHVGVSRRSLELRFREVVGRTPGEEVRRLRAGLWRRLLTDTDLSIAEVAHRCGFGAPATFAAAVRRVEGVAPTSLRRRAQKVRPSGSN